MKKFFIHTRASLARAVLSRVLSRPRYRPLLSVLVDSEVRGTTLQKLIVDSEVRGTTLQKLIASESEVKSE